MSNPARIKQLATAHACLRFAKSYVSADLPAGIPANTVPLGLVERELSEEGLVSCMDLLAACGTSEAPRGGFWRNLQLAAEALDQVDRAATYDAYFHATLARQVS